MVHGFPYTNELNLLKCAMATNIITKAMINRTRVFKFDVENTVWANGETYEKLSDFLTRELIGRRLVSMK